MKHLSKKLETRHINMIALGGSIGTGIFLASGYSIALGGPGGAILGYSLMAVIIYFLMTSVGEMSVFSPSAGGVADYCTKYVGPSFGVGMGYTYWFTWAITIPAEISAASLIVRYWFPQLNSAMFSLVFFALICVINIFSVRWYGEVEYWMSFIKISVIVLFIIIGTSILFEKPQIEVHNLFIGDAPFHNGWLGFISVFLFAGYAFQGTELIGVASGEARDPSTAIPTSIRMVFWRLTLFYVVSIAIISMLIPYTNPTLTNQNDVATSPYTLVFAKYLFHYAGDAINFVILIALLSAANASLYSATRTLWYLAKKGENTFLAKLNNKNVPKNALIVTSSVGIIAFILSFLGNGEAFTVLVNISSISWFVAAIGIAYSHCCFRMKYLPKHGGVKSLVYRSKLFPIAPIVTIISLVAIILGQFLLFDNTYTLIEKISVYAGALLFFVFYGIHKIILIFRYIKMKKSK